MIIINNIYIIALKRFLVKPPSKYLCRQQTMIIYLKISALLGKIGLTDIILSHTITERKNVLLLKRATLDQDSGS